MTQHTRQAHNKNKCEHFLSVCMAILAVFVLFIGLFLAYYSLRYSYYSPTSYIGPVQLIKDNTFLNLATFAAVVLLSLLLQKLFEKLGDKQRLTGYLFLGLCCLIYMITALIWVTELPYYPSGDQLKATAAAHYHLDGNFIMLKTSGYLGKYPQQKGLAFLYEILFSIFGDFCYPVAAKLHIMLGVITMITGYLFVEETSYNSICKIMYCPLFILCTPYLILTPYTYGDLPSICFCMIIFLSLLRYTRTGNNFYVILCCIMASLSLMMRMHTWIALIALLIGLLLILVQKKVLAPFLAGMLIVVSAAGSINALDYYYASRSGYPITKGAPAILWLAMGMQDNEGGPGTFNNYQTTILSEVDYDREAAAEIAKDNLQENVEYFIENPSYAKWFFKTKLAMQWTEPTFETLLSTHSFDEELSVPKWIWEIYYGKYHDPLLNFADRYQSVVYLGFLFYLPVLWRKRKENAASYIPLIAIVGGFLFSIIWEAQCRYVLPYYMFMLLYVPDGITQISEWIRLAYKKLKNRMYEIKE